MINTHLQEEQHAVKSVCPPTLQKKKDVIFVSRGFYLNKATGSIVPKNAMTDTGVECIV